MIWFALAIITLILELLINVVYLLVLAVAFLVTGLSEYLFHTDLNTNLIIAAVLSMIGITAVAIWNKKKRKQFKPASDDLDVGQIVVIDSLLPNGNYYVKYRGTLWEAQLNNHHHLPNNIIGSKAKIVRKESNTLIIHLITDS